MQMEICEGVTRQPVDWKMIWMTELHRKQHTEGENYSFSQIQAHEYKSVLLNKSAFLYGWLPRQ